MYSTSNAMEADSTTDCVYHRVESCRCEQFETVVVNGVVDRVCVSCQVGDKELEDAVVKEEKRYARLKSEARHLRGMRHSQKPHKSKKVREKAQITVVPSAKKIPGRRNATRRQKTEPACLKREDESNVGRSQSNQAVTAKDGSEMIPINPQKLVYLCALICCQVLFWSRFFTTYNFLNIGY